MLSINPDEYVNYDIGASLPEGLSYVEGQGLVVYGAQHSGQQRLQLTINPDALQGSKNLFDSSKGQLNSELYDQMSLPDGMSFDKTNGLKLTSSNTNNSVVINPNSVVGITELFDANTKKVNKSISSLPTGLTYSSNSGLEITGATSNESLVIDANGFSQKTNLFNSGSSKINEDLYDAGEGRGVPDWVVFDDQKHSIEILGFPSEYSELIPSLNINAGLLERTSYLIDSQTKMLKGVLPEGMTFTPATGLTLENTGGGRITIPVGDGVFKGQADLFRFTDYVPDPYANEASSTNAEYYVACNVPTYLTAGGSNSILHSSLSGYFFNNEDGTTKRITNIGGASIHLWEYDKSKKETKDIVVMNDDGLDPDGIKTGIDAEKITKGTLTRPIEITDESFGQKMMIDASTIHCQNRVVTSTMSGYYDTFSLLNRRDDTTTEFHVNLTFYDWELDHITPKFVTALKSEDIENPEGITIISSDAFSLRSPNNKLILSEDVGMLYTGTENIFKIDPSGAVSSYTPDSTTQKLEILGNSITSTGTKSVFKVYPSGNMVVYDVFNFDNRTQIIRNCIENIHNGRLYFRSTSLYEEQETRTLLNLPTKNQSTWNLQCLWLDGATVLGSASCASSSIIHDPITE